MVKKAAPNNLIVNRRARFDYDIRDIITAGIVLTGREVRAVRDNRANLRGAYATIKDGELWLNNASFSIAPAPGSSESVIDTNPRKLLVSKKQLAELAEAKEQGLTIVPLHMTTGTRYIKVAVATAKGKKQYDKRETIKRRDIEREHQRQLKR